MIVKCRGCNGALSYDVITDKMKCEYCGQLYSVGELQTNEEKQEAAQTSNVMPQYDVQYGQAAQYNQESVIDSDMMDCNIYNCTACGAQLMINGVESSTYCAYCGQPTVVFSRVSKQKKPKYIIPFSITKERAVELIRERFNNGSFVPQEIKDFKIDTVRGIYVPFWMYDMDYEEEVVVKSRVKSGKSTRTIFSYRNGRTHFKRMKMDASVRFNDKSSKRLEPYDLLKMQDFNVQYLSGFYADCSDERTADLDTKAFVRARKMFEEEIIKDVRGSSVEIIASNPRYTIEKKNYLMLPAWFMVFKYEGKSYTMIVNGQTGKVVGAVPYKRVAVYTFAAVLSAVCVAFSIPTVGMMVDYCTFNVSEKVGGLAILAIIGLLSGFFKKCNKFKESQNLTEEDTMRKFVKDRQEGM